ncbi:MAG: C1 family peptidase [Rikenellaceae bacterium]
MKKTILITLALACSTQLMAQNITPDILKDIKQNYTKNHTNNALRNAIQSNKSLNTLSLDHDVLNAIDHNFKYKTPQASPITDQQSSGRCWMFTSMNVIRPQLIEKFNLPKFNFSQNYNYFWDIFEKSNLFLNNIIETADKDIMDREVATYFSSPVDDGGVWNHFYNVAKKYGVVPAEIMPETIHSNNTYSMLSVLKERLRKGGWDLREAINSGAKNKKVEALKKEVLSDIYRTLALCLGEPPVEFDWKYIDKDGNTKVIENYTPLQFFNDLIPDDYNENNYIMVMNDPTREYYKVYDIDNYRNTEEGTNWVYLNLPNEDIKAAALKSIKAGESMYVSCDVGKQLNSSEGVLAMGMYDTEGLMGVDLSMSKEARILTRQSGSAHAMNLVACDTDENDVPVKWQFENSWGSAGHNGYLTFTDEWLDNYLFRMVVCKRYLDERALSALESDVISLPVWDYMF